MRIKRACDCDGVLYNYRISCFTNFTGNEKKPFTKVKAHISTINFISASAENFGETDCDIYFT